MIKTLMVIGTVLFPQGTVLIDNLQQTMCVANAVYHEAANQPLIGQQAVAQNINNRTVSRKLTHCEVVFQKSQYSFTLIPSKTRTDRLLKANPIDTKAKFKALSVAYKSLRGDYSGLINGATHYYNYNTANPNWKDSFLTKVYIGDHVFLSDNCHKSWTVKDCSILDKNKNKVKIIYKD